MKSPQIKNIFSSTAWETNEEVVPIFSNTDSQTEEHTRADAAIANFLLSFWEMLPSQKNFQGKKFPTQSPQVTNKHILGTLMLSSWCRHRNWRRRLWSRRHPSPPSPLASQCKLALAKITCQLPPSPSLANLASNLKLASEKSISNCSGHFYWLIWPPTTLENLPPISSW